MCDSWQNTEIILNASKELSLLLSRLGVRLESQQSLIRFLAETYIFILNFSLVFLPYSSAEPFQIGIKHDHSPVVIVVLDPSYESWLIIQGLVYL